MANNFRAHGGVFEFAAPADVVSGQGLLLNGQFGVVLGTAKAGELICWKNCEAWSLAKANGAPGTFAVGDKIYWDDTAKKITKTVGSNTLIGRALEPALAADLVGTVVLYPVA